MNIQLCCNSNEEKLQQQAGHKISSLIKGKNVLLLLSGGSAIAILDYIDLPSLSKKVTISVLDERYSRDTMVNNFSQISETFFYSSAKNEGCNFIDTRMSINETQEHLVDRYENALRKWKKENKDGIIIATQGMGMDGHTAGIMPYPENPSLFSDLFEDSTKWAVGYDAGDKNVNPLRVTVTIPFLKMIDYTIFYAPGDIKKDSLKKALSKNTKVNEVPATVIHQMKNVEVYTDQKIA